MNPQGTTKKKLLLLKAVIGVFVVAIASAGYYYVYSHQATKVKNLNSQISTLNSNVSSLTTELSAKKDTSVIAPTTTPVKTLSDEEQALAAAKAYCEASLDSTTNMALIFTPGTAKGKSVLFSNNASFAYINARCATTSEQEGGGSAAYYLKKVNSTWVFLYRGQEPDENMTKLFGIPSDFN